MRRREFVTLLGGAAAALPPFAALAQLPTKRMQIALLLASSKAATQERLSAFRLGMQELGYIENRDYVIDDRYAAGDLARFATLVREMVQLKPDVIVSGTTVGIPEVRRQTETIPIVGVSLTDPVGFGLAASLARPGGQVTGILITSDSSAAKQVELALEVLPGASKIGMLENVGNPSNTVHRRNVEVATAALGLKLVTGEASAADDLDAAFQTLAREHVAFVVMLLDGLFVSERRRIVELAATTRLPVLYPYREHFAVGGLMSYGVDLRESWRRAATFVDKILKGAKPADLPIEQPTKLELLINVKTAKALGLTIPPAVLARADEVIE
jgi:putative ABC transport system substrate-binding protein